MKDRYWLVEVDNDQLVAALSKLVRREHDLLSDLLAHLAELDERRLYLDLGYSSLFAYCTEKLEFCPASAGRRIAAARLCRSYPELFGRVAQGELQLTVLSLLAQHAKSNLNADNARELFEACSHKSGEEVELLLAARFPKPDVRESIRRLPARPTAPSSDTESSSTSVAAAAPALVIAAEPAAPPLSASAMGSAQAMNGSNPRVAAESSRAQLPQGRVEPLASDRFGVHLTVDAEFRELLEEVRALRSHVDPKADLATIMKQGLEAYRRELLKDRFGIGRWPRRARSPKAKQAKARRSRHIPSAVAREVYVRDEGRSTFCSEEGRRCGSREFLQLDHVVPWAAQGPPTVDNLRLRCRGHNQHAAHDYFGSAHMRTAVELARAQR